jgi:hypothetical protein
MKTLVQRRSTTRINILSEEGDDSCRTTIQETAGSSTSAAVMDYSRDMFEKPFCMEYKISHGQVLLLRWNNRGSFTMGAISNKKDIWIMFPCSELAPATRNDGPDPTLSYRLDDIVRHLIGILHDYATKTNIYWSWASEKICKLWVWSKGRFFTKEETTDICKQN